jgi:hypothetical protein
VDRLPDGAEPGDADLLGGGEGSIGPLEFKPQVASRGDEDESVGPAGKAHLGAEDTPGREVNDYALFGGEFEMQEQSSSMSQSMVWGLHTGQNPAQQWSSAWRVLALRSASHVLWLAAVIGVHRQAQELVGVLLTGPSRSRQPEPQHHSPGTVRRIHPRCALRSDFDGRTRALRRRAARAGTRGRARRTSACPIRVYRPGRKIPALR